MTSTNGAAAKIIEGFRQSNGTFHRERLHDENTLSRQAELHGRDHDVAVIIGRVLSQLIAAVGNDIEHAVIVNAPTGAPGGPFDYHCAVFSHDLLAYIEFTTAGVDPQLLVRVIPRRTLAEIEIRAAKDYNSGGGPLVLVARYDCGITIDIRERGTEGQDIAEPRPWLDEILKDLRKDLVLF